MKVLLIIKTFILIVFLEVNIFNKIFGIKERFSQRLISLPGDKEKEKMYINKLIIYR